MLNSNLGTELSLAKKLGQKSIQNKISIRNHPLDPPMLYPRYTWDVSEKKNFT